MRRFEFAGDDAGGWLLVTAPDLAKAGLYRRHFSNASLISPKGVIALDHAADALLFVQKWKANFGDCEIGASATDAATIASWSPFGTKGIDPEPFKTNADFNQEQTEAQVAEEERAAAAYARQMQDCAFHSQD